jgi:8-oxo-dGTP diphosphatase
MADEAAMEGSPPPRPTARVVLLDPDDRLLLMRGRLPSAPDEPSFWFTVGGGAEPGETVREAAAREVFEETGFTDVELGPELWYDEVILEVAGDPRLLQQHYFLARTAGGELSRAGWQQLELDFVEELRWWTLAELRATSDKLYPEGLPELMGDVLAGRIAASPRVLNRTPAGG